MIQDNKHGLKTAWNNLFSGACLLIAGNYTMGNQDVHELAFCEDSPHYALLCPYLITLFLLRLPLGACTIINHGRNLEVITTTLKIYQDSITALPKILTAIKQLQACGRKGKAQEGEADSGAEEDE
ncbi:hypothetical protein C8Q72DRAFT_856435 [Fomitopsis betulina]|nr:hypothetical protein C8Q72DRAFT_856435 [Fomitopsis betulina]